MNTNINEENNLYTFSKYANDTKQVSNSMTIALIVLFIYLSNPFNKYRTLSTTLLVSAFIILGFALWKNLHITYKFSKSSNIYYFDGSWSNIKNNMICSYVFSVFIIILIITVIKNIF